MTLPRLTDDPSKSAYGSMLRKARRESLSPEAEQRIAAAVLAPAVAMAKPASSALRGLVAKGAIGLSALALVCTFAVARRSSDVSPVAAPLAAAAASTNTALGEAVSPLESAPAEHATVSVHDLPPVAAGRAAAPTPSDDLAAEAALLRATREDIANGRSREALRKLGQYDARFGSKGAMLEEASVERVEALQQAGRSTEARALATRLLAERPDGAFARKLRSLLTSLESPYPVSNDSK
ncbi:hypothetical protein AKJ09_09333 [Labilithrix luteola]|uniref:Uncharacterized protein n=1 Tax=Labilithrix luteola TaxID=1391654 RepID=A0A0K1QB82_9BACT|nr:hypothetical protein [Labilithrix luteola]AKV02670.1 hypothetical protein AKJ09_09333 [Labilithrix luteola]